LSIRPETFAQLVSDFCPLNQFIPKFLLLFIKTTIRNLLIIKPEIKYMN